ncbi:hypothetical protein POM88_022118 [Heracleum sosnowskyi]|uniref:Uncharacterized protein n=1 Tax=Heracleum sosnowskyi TaxID=360622 RepID=A0AAD8IFW6_9APIA|nr:hypothetical protein POM88_022118 [Heracleum sosnowskyi]
MGTMMFSGTCFSLKCNQNIALSRSAGNGLSRTKARAAANSELLHEESDQQHVGLLKRRLALVSGVSLLSSAILSFPKHGLAVVKQGLLAGRIPGLSEPDVQGWRTYQRPDEKSGGHGVGWSPII